jgi:hypothetical protein
MMLLNAFSFNMCGAFPVTVHATELTLGEAQQHLAEGFESAVGHADTAAVFANVLGLTVEARRATVSLKTGDRAVVGQYRGPRLAEGATELPEGATIQWLLVEVK